MTQSWKSLLVKEPQEFLQSFKAKKPKKTELDKRREMVIAGLDTVIAQVERKESPKRGWYEIKSHPETQQDWAVFTVRARRRRLLIEGAEQNSVPLSDLLDVYRGIKADVESGEFDSAIMEAYGDKPVKTPKSGGGRADAGRKRGPLSPESLTARRAKTALTKNQALRLRSPND